MTISGDLNPPAIYGEAVPGQESARSTEVLKQLEEITKGIENETFDVAELLHEVKTHEYYQNWNYESFADYVKGALKMKARKASYLVRIIHVSEKMGIPRAKFEPLGIAKVREIFSLDPDGEYINNEKAQAEPLHEHILRLLDEAPNLTHEDIVEEVRRLKGLTGESSLVWVRLKMPKSAKENVYDKAIELAKMRLGSAGRTDEGEPIEYSEGAALECVCAEFLADPNNHPQTEEPVNDDETTEGEKS